MARQLGREGYHHLDELTVIDHPVVVGVDGPVHLRDLGSLYLGEGLALVVLLLWQHARRPLAQLGVGRVGEVCTRARRKERVSSSSSSEREREREGSSSDR